MFKRLISLATIILTLLLSGCNYRQPKAQPTQFSYHKRPCATQPGRIAVLPFYHGDEVGESAVALDKAMAKSFRELGLHETIAISHKERDMHFGQHKYSLNLLTPDVLRTFREKHYADMIIIGLISSWSSYDPMQIGLEIHMVSCRDGSSCWSATGQFDGARADIQEDIEDWYNDIIGEGQLSIGGWQRTLERPSLFCRYVSDRLAATIIMHDPE